MKKTTHFLMVASVLLFSVVALAQSTVTGTVIDADLNAPLPGANIIENGTSNGVSTDFDGNFTLTTQASTGQIIVSYVGFGSVTLSFNGNTDLGNITISPDNSLEEILIVGVVDFAKDRQTPVAVSTIKAAEIQEKLGSQELPEILNKTPSIYATKSGGGFGDSRINVRGFDQTNVAVMINGVPVNDMENGRVFWSNWAGLSDVSTGIQVQRGLGSSKLAISSVGGTINVLTKTTDREQGGSVGFITGNNNYLKTVTSYSTGKMDNGFAMSAILSRSAGDGYVNGTSFEGYNYFLGFGYDKGDHNLQLTVTGAPQVHNQRTTSFFNMATLEDYLEYGRKYNYNHGYLNGEEFNWRRNFYHKPIASLNWDWHINEKSSISTVLYASIGRGGGTGDIGRLGGNFASSSRFRNPNNGHVLWNQIVASNSGTVSTFNRGFVYGNTPDFQTGTFIVNDADLFSSTDPEDANDPDNLIGVNRRNGFIRRASMNSHNWFGALANFNTELSETLTFDVGIDLRSYKGIHYRRVDNFLGADGYRDNDDINNPFNIVTQNTPSDLSGLWNVFKSIDDDKKIDYYNDGKVRWLGVFTQLEYNKDKISAFIQGALSQQGFQRVDYFAETPANQETDWENIIGGNIKGGVNYNIDDNHNVFANAGFYSRQPNFDAVYINFSNTLNTDLQNEKVLGFELGYGYRSEKFRANVNLYRTSWKDRFLNVSSDFDVNNTPNDDDDDVEGSTNLSGIEQIHMGVEVEANYRINDFISLNGMLSVGNWEYGGDVSGTALDDSQNVVGTNTLYLDGVKVGDAAQFTSMVGIEIRPLEGLRIDADWRTADNLYADINPEDFDFEDHQGSLKLPSYDLVDAGISYQLKVGKQKENSVNLRLNVNNVFSEVYIAESATNTFADSGDDTFNGINVDNKVFFGFGRTWNFGINYRF